MNRPRSGQGLVVRIPPPTAELERFFADWRDELASVRKWEPAVRNYTSARLMSLIGPRVSECCLAAIGDVRFDLGRFGRFGCRARAATAGRRSG